MLFFRYRMAPQTLNINLRYDGANVSGDSMPAGKVPAKSTSARYYRPELDAIRFLAFLLVFFHHNLPSGDDPHFAAYPKGFSALLTAVHYACSFGLSLFFTLSAFLICELLLREREAIGTVAVKQFYIRRILRIWPLYFLAIAIGAILALLPGSNLAILKDLGWYAVFLGSWFTVFHGWIASPVAPLWSISVEEQFYLLAPWSVKYLSRTALYVFCAAILLVSNGWLYYFGAHGAGDSRIWTDTFVQFECFAAGILLCLVLRGKTPKLAIWQRLLLLVLWWFSWLYANYGLHSRFNIVGVTDNPGSWPLIGGYALTSLGSVLVLLAFLGLDPKLIPAWATYLGRISFGLYVFHQFVIELAYHLVGHGAQVSFTIRILRVAFTLGLTVLIAAISYRFFETPFLKLKKRHAVINSQPIGTSNT